MTLISRLLADVPPYGLGLDVGALVWLLPVAGLVIGLWLGARARRGRGARGPSQGPGERDDA